MRYAYLGIHRVEDYANMTMYMAVHGRARNSCETDNDTRALYRIDCAVSSATAQKVMV